MQNSSLYPGTRWHGTRRAHAPLDRRTKEIGVLLASAIFCALSLLAIVPTLRIPNIKIARNIPVAPFNQNALASKPIASQPVNDNLPPVTDDAAGSVAGLIQSLGADEPASSREQAVAQLASTWEPEIIPALFSAINDSDPFVRAGAAQILGLRHESAAFDWLLQATRDPSARVRREAIDALVLIDGWQMLPRLDQLLVYEPNDRVRQSAFVAKEAFKAQMAAELEIPGAQLRGLAMGADSSRLFAVTTRDLYLRQNGTWQWASNLPDVPVALAVGRDPQLVYLATENLGLYRSVDSGATWNHVEFGLQTPTELSVTSVAIDPTNDQQLFIALATPGALPQMIDALGEFSSSDGGATWVWLPDSPNYAITTQLAVDADTPEYLYGIAEDTPWRFKLP
jgi:hypothetical protein